jgi:hypothetical protein
MDTNVSGYDALRLIYRTQSVPAAFRQKLRRRFKVKPVIARWGYFDSIFYKYVALTGLNKNAIMQNIRSNLACNIPELSS